jgi:hypothetical protein
MAFGAHKAPLQMAELIFSQLQSPGKNGPHPHLFPLPRQAGEGEGGEGCNQDPRCRRGRNYVTCHGGLTYDMNLGYRTLAQMRLVPKGQ